MKRLKWLAAMGLLTGAPLAAQQPPAAPPAPAAVPLAVGADAPLFSLMGGTRTGVIGPVSPADFQDKTLVIAFFFRARTSG
jgi:hypothetical protein